MARAYLGLGSNVGDRAGHLRFAAHALADRGALVARSPLIETLPADGADGGMFLNACVRLDTPLGPRGLLEEAMRIERAMGRTRHRPNAPRTLDIDILLAGDLVIDEPGLAVPHPRMHRRLFVLEPLAAIAPREIHRPTGLSIRELLARRREWIANAGALGPTCSGDAALLRAESG